MWLPLLGGRIMWKGNHGARQIFVSSSLTNNERWVWGVETTEYMMGSSDILHTFNQKSVHCI